MKIYVGHSKNINYEEELYKPIRKIDTKHKFIFPHENNNNVKNSRDYYSNFDMFIAEVSMPATGLGIELGFAYDSNIPIFCIYKKNSKISSSLNCITNNFFEYETEEELIKVIRSIIDSK
jgi:hypothetical protein